MIDSRTSISTGQFMTGAYDKNAGKKCNADEKRKLKPAMLVRKLSAMELD